MQEHPDLKIIMRINGLKTNLMVKERAVGGKYEEFDRKVTTSDTEAFKRAKKAATYLASGVTDFAEIGRLASGKKRRRGSQKTRSLGEVRLHHNGRGHVAAPDA
jgi:tRNA U54 and U55 pseudouridine synthase Pus10